MDTHWFSKKKGWVSALDRGARGLFAAALIVTTFGPLALQNATADTLEWTDIAGFDGSGTGIGDVFWNPTGAGTLIDVSVCDEGTVFALGLKGADGFEVYRSSDKGMSWEQTTPNDEGGAGTVPVRIACSPNFSKDGAVFVLVNTVFGPLVAMSRNSGADFDGVPANITALAFTAGATDAGTGTSLAISGDFDATDEGTIAIGQVLNDAAEGIVAVNTWNGTVWSSATSWTTGLTVTGMTLDVGDHAADVALSPNFTNDSTLAAIISGIGPGDVDTQTHVLITSGTADFPAPTATTEVNNAELVPADTLVTAPDAFGGKAEIFLPSNFDGDASNPRYYIAIDAATGAGDVYERISTGWEPKQANEAVSGDYWSLAGTGEFATPTLLAAQNSTADPATNLALGDADSWNEETDSYGAGIRRVVLDPTGTNAYFVSLGATNGLLGRSSTQGGRWNGTSLLNNDADDEIVFFTGGPNNRLGMLMNVDGAGTTVDHANALFVTTNPGTSNTGWTRGDNKTTALSDFERVIQIRFAPDNPATVWLIDDADDVDQVGRSTNGGETFANTALDPGSETPIALAAVSAAEALVADSDGFVWRTTNSGATWTKSTTDLGSDVHMMVASPAYATDKTLLAGVTSTGGRLEVMRSVDNGLTWTMIGSSSETDAWAGGGTFMHVAFDPRYATNMIVYAGPDGAGDDIYRYDLDATTPRWIEMDANAGPVLGGSPTRGLQVLAMGNTAWLFAVNEDGEIARNNCPDLITEDIDAAVCEWLVSAPVVGVGAGDITINEALFVGASGSDVRIFVAANLAPVPGIFEFTETAAELNGPALLSPRTGSTVPANSGINGQPFNIRWADISDCTAYEIQLSNDPTFIGGLPFFTGTETLLIGAGTLANGETEYWRVRCIAVNGVPHEGGWSNQGRFTVGVPSGEESRPQISLPLNGSQLSSLSTTVSWNNPAGTAQVHIEVTPLNGDGPAINLIIGSAINQYVIPEPLFGTGPYVMLPGATYTVRVRSTSSIDPNITVGDQSWTAWSDVITFTTAPPTSGTIQLLTPINGASTSDTTPTLQWKDSSAAMFYYEVQLSQDPNFGSQGAVSPVYWNLIHAGESNPPSSWTVPDAFALTPGVWHWRARQRLQATPRGSLETGIAWTPSQTFTVAP